MCSTAFPTTSCRPMIWVSLERSEQLQLQFASGQGSGLAVFFFFYFSSFSSFFRFSPSILKGSG